MIFVLQRGKCYAGAIAMTLRASVSYGVLMDKPLLNPLLMVRSGKIGYGSTMMMRTLIATALASTLLLGSAGFAYAQVTDQTDQSEEDWRKSRKKSGTSDIFNPNNTTIGTGLGTIGDIEPVSPVERLPSESRRHLMRERAKAIAESADGDISGAEYEPSEAAKNDEALMRDEKEAWDVITTDIEGAGGQADTPSQGGPNTVAVTGRNGTAPAPGSRGGSTATLQQIMDAIKAGQMGNGTGGSGSGGGQGDGTGSGSQPAVAQSPNGQSPSGQIAGVGTLPQGQPNGAGNGQSPSQGQGQSQGQNQGQAQGQGQSNGQTEGTSQSNGSESGAGQTSGNDGSASDSKTNSADQVGTTEATGQQSDGGNAAGDPTSQTAPTQTRAARSREDLSPLERLRQSREERDAAGDQRSASDYLGGED
jgi:hypothetical protein